MVLYSMLTMLMLVLTISKLYRCAPHLFIVLYTMLMLVLVLTLVKSTGVLPIF